MKNINFQNLFRPSRIVENNVLFTHLYSPETPLVYDYNEIQFKKMPSYPEFFFAEEYLFQFQFKHLQNHLKFCFPENQPLPSELIDYFIHAEYGKALLELYSIHPEQFPETADTALISIQEVTSQYLQTYLTFEYGLDIQFGSAFAEQKQFLYKNHFHSSNILQLLAYYQGIPAGSVDVILSENTAELDNFIVLPPYRNKGIGSRLQKYVMNQFANKIVILAADGYDTAREMYRKQNYQYLGYRYEVLKVNE